MKKKSLSVKSQVALEQSLAVKIITTILSIVALSTALGFFTATIAVNLAALPAKTGKATINPCISEPISASCMISCGKQTTDDLRWQCLRNACAAKYPPSTKAVMYNFCVNPQRVGFSVIGLMIKVRDACLPSSGGNPTSAACAMAQAYEFKDLDYRYKTLCSGIFPQATSVPPNTIPAITPAEQCYFDLQDLDVISNELLNCSSLSTKKDIFKCTGYLGMATKNKPRIDYFNKVSSTCARLSPACSLSWNTRTKAVQQLDTSNCEQIKNTCAQPESSAIKAVCDSANSKCLNAKAGKAETKGLSVLEYMAIFGDFVVGNGTVGTPFDQWCGIEWDSSASYSLRVGSFGSSPHQVCSLDRGGCADDAINGNRQTQNSFAFNLSNKCKNYTWPDSYASCPNIWGLISPAFGRECYCSHVSAALEWERDHLGGRATAMPEACNLCASPDPNFSATADGYYEWSMCGTTVKGTKDFLTKLVKLQNCIGKATGDCNALCGLCEITSSYRSGPNEKEHSKGSAVDFCCSSANKESALNLIKSCSAETGFNILQEFSQNEQACTGESGCSQGGIFHLDNKDRGSCIEPCLFQNLIPCPAGSTEGVNGCYGTPLCKGWTNGLPLR